MVPGRDGTGEIFPAGSAIKDETETVRGRPMGVYYYLTPRYQLIVTVATVGTPRVPADLESARWRCRLVDMSPLADRTADVNAPGRDVTNQLIGNTEILTDWFADTVAQFALEERRPQRTDPLAAIVSALPSEWQDLLRQEATGIRPEGPSDTISPAAPEEPSSPIAADDPLLNRERVITFRDDDLTEENDQHAGPDT